MMFPPLSEMNSLPVPPVATPPIDVATGRSIIYSVAILTAMAAKIVHGFGVHLTSSSLRDQTPSIIGRQLLASGPFFRSMAEPVSKPPTTSCSSKNSHIKVDDGIEMVEGYEYVHPAITAMLLTKACSNNEDNDNFISLVVDPLTFTLQMESKEESDFGYSTTGVMSIKNLASLAEECERVIFSNTKWREMFCARNGNNLGENNGCKIPQKVIGLICLSQLPSSSWPEQNAAIDAFFGENKETGDANSRNPATLVATMVALILLESSIRSVVQSRTSSTNSNKGNANGRGESQKFTRIRRNSNNSDTQRKKGAPLLRDMIEEISNIDDSISKPSIRSLESIRESSTELQIESSSSSFSSKLLPLYFLAPVLRALLLPTKDGGINLRNLISHGFLSTVDQRWFALTVVLIQTLEYASDFEVGVNDCSGMNIDLSRTSEEEISQRGDDEMDRSYVASSLRKYDSMANEVYHGRDILLKDDLHIGIKILESFGKQKVELTPPSSSGYPGNQFVPDSHIILSKFTLQVLALSVRQIFYKTMQIGHSTTEATEIVPENVYQMKEQSLPSLTTIFVTTMSSLIEHSLRILWCRANHRLNDQIAQPSQYYVTLDGHGQRDKHDVVISPFLRDGSKNQIIPLIGAPSCALLADLFAAPSKEAPNVRSAVYHGTWDGEIIKELEELACWALHVEGENEGTCDHEVVDKLNTLTQGETSHPILVDAACALISSFDIISSNISGTPRASKYRPVYSYTAMGNRHFSEVFHNLKLLDLLISSNSSIYDCINIMKKQRSKLFNDLRPLKTQTNLIQDMYFDIFPTSSKAIDEIWEAEDIYSEHSANVILSHCNAAQKLLSDTSQAVNLYLEGVQAGMGKLSLEPHCTKDCRVMKSMTSFCGVASVALDFFTFAVYMVLLMIKIVVRDNSPNADLYHNDVSLNDLSREDIVKAVERTRMTLSTFDSYLVVNLDRSLKAVQQYIQGKAVKKVIEYKSQFCDGGIRK